VRRREVLALGSIFVVAAGLRCWRLAWGLDQGGFPDEIIWSTRSSAFVPLSLASFDLPRSAFVYPTVYGYLTGLATAALHGVGAVVPGTDSPTLMLVARVVSAAAGVATAAVVGLAGWRMWSTPAGLAAGALMAVAPLHVMQTHVAAPDVVLTLFVALTILLAHELATSGGKASAVLAGAAAACAAATKYPGVACVVPVAWALAERVAATPRRATVLPLALSALGGFVVAGVLACPPCIRHADWMISAIRVQAWFMTLGCCPNNELQPSLGWYGRPYLYELVATLPYTLGWPLYALALLGVGLALWRHDRPDRLALATLAPFFVVMGGARIVFPRYFMPLYPGLVLLGARALGAFRRPWVSRAVFAVVFAYSFVLSATQVARFSLRQQLEAGRWIASAIAARGDAAVRVATPADLSPGLDYFRLTPALRAAGLSVIPAEPGHWLDGQPEAVVVPEWLEIAYRRDVLVRERDRLGAADLARLQSGAAGYHEARRWSSWYLQRRLYTWLDPAFAADLWQGEIGAVVYLRDDVAPR
jgi:hypothetical protein